MQVEECISVRGLVEFILRSGSIDNMSGTIMETDAMQLGTRIHQKLQKAAGPDYRAEVPMKHSSILGDELIITVQGRADGIITESAMVPDDTGMLSLEEVVTIDEIKGTTREVRNIREPAVVHQAQAKCYAYMYALENGLKEISVQVTYAGLENDHVKRFKEKFTFKELKVWYEDLVERYAVWVRWSMAWKAGRDASIVAGEFPFEYRESQKKLVAGIYQTILRKKRLFIQAPTGTGKTLAALYPAIKTMGSGMSEKIFYLTARTIARTVAEDSLNLLGDHGFSLKRITLTAKEKLCVLDEVMCSPAWCPRAEGHFDRVNDAVFDIINHENSITREVILAYAQKHSVCPFELQLDVSLWCDIIICDYNYAFDPDVALKRYFDQGGGSYLFLVDEAHNLVERGRNMYSAQLSLREFYMAKSQLKGIGRKLSGRLDQCIKVMENLNRSSDKRCEQIAHAGTVVTSLSRMTEAAEARLKEEMTLATRQELLDLYFKVRKFIAAFDRQDDDKYITYILREDGDMTLHIYCVDPSGDLGKCLARARSTIFFSATLIPVGYYKEMLSDTGGEDYDLYVDSPFAQERRFLAAATDVSTRYTQRGEDMYSRIADYIRQIIRGRHGNYMIFFPSYQLMLDVFEAFSDLELMKAGHALKVIVQEPGMDEESRAAFLEAFAAGGEESTIGFCVMGGIFSEGIDLKEDRLIGAIVVGTGLPQVSPERELVKGFFELREKDGYAYAYLYPGMNKVQQAAGRVIRTEKDAGIIALLDERFNYSSYRQLFPKEWSDLKKTNIRKIGEQIENFWTEVRFFEN